MEKHSSHDNLKVLPRTLSLLSSKKKIKNTVSVSVLFSYSLKPPLSLRLVNLKSISIDTAARLFVAPVQQYNILQYLNLCMLGHFR